METLRAVSSEVSAAANQSPLGSVDPHGFDQWGNKVIHPNYHSPKQGPGQRSRGARPHSQPLHTYEELTMQH